MVSQGPLSYIEILSFGQAGLPPPANNENLQKFLSCPDHVLSLDPRGLKPRPKRFKDYIGK